MLASELIKQLQTKIEKYGDLNVVSGLGRCGYGEPVDAVMFYNKARDTAGNITPVFDLVLSDNSLVAIGGF